MSDKLEKAYIYYMWWLAWIKETRVCVLERYLSCLAVLGYMVFWVLCYFVLSGMTAWLYLFSRQTNQSSGCKHSAAIVSRCEVWINPGQPWYFLVYLVYVIHYLYAKQYVCWWWLGCSCSTLGLFWYDTPQPPSVRIQTPTSPSTGWRLIVTDKSCKSVSLATSEIVT